jgi:hypothetical protein
MVSEESIAAQLQRRVCDEVVPLLTRSFVDASQKNGAGAGTRPESGGPLTRKCLDAAFQAAVILVLRLLVLFFGEARRLLPAPPGSAGRTASLTELAREIAGALGDSSETVRARSSTLYRTELTHLYERLSELFDTIARGDRALGIEPYSGCLFFSDRVSGHPMCGEGRESGRRHGAALRGGAARAGTRDGADRCGRTYWSRVACALARWRIPDLEIAQAIDLLARGVDSATGALFPIDYRRVDVRLLGSIYESLVGSRLGVARRKLARVRRGGAAVWMPWDEMEERGRERAARAGMVIEKGGIYLERDRSRRRTRGSYYTPAHIVRHLVESAVGPVFEGRRKVLIEQLDAMAPRVPGRAILDHLLGIRVLDPAMGSGNFLLEAAAFLTARTADVLDEICSDRAPEERRRVRRSVLRTLGARDREQDFSSPELRHLLWRRVLGQCIYGVDLDPVAVELARASLWLETPGPERGGAPPGRNLVCGDSLECRPDGGRGDALAGLPNDHRFDVVITNPPWGAEFLPEQTALYRKHYRTAEEGVVNSYALFLDRSTQLARRGGYIGILLPDIVLLKDYEVVRRFVLDHLRIVEIIDWGRPFADAKLDACSFVCERSDEVPDGEPIRCVTEIASWEEKVFRERYVTHGTFRRNDALKFNLYLDDALERSLSIVNRGSTPLSDYFKIREGIHSGNIRSKLFVERRTSEVCRPLVLRGAEVLPFFIDWAGRYVVYDPAIVDRTKGEYANLGEQSWFTGPKLLVRRTGDRIIAAVDRAGIYASNNLFVVMPLVEHGLPLEFFEGFLNSSLATWYFRSIQPRTGRLFSELKIVHLRALRVPAIRKKRCIEEIVSLVQALRQGLEASRGEWDPALWRPLRDLDAIFAEGAGLNPLEIGQTVPRHAGSPRGRRRPQQRRQRQSSRTPSGRLQGRGAAQRPSS